MKQYCTISQSILHEEPEYNKLFKGLALFTQFEIEFKIIDSNPVLYMVDLSQVPYTQKGMPFLPKKNNKRVHDMGSLVPSFSVTFVLPI